VDSFWSSLADEFVEETNVGERSAGHDLVVSPSRPVRVEITRSQPFTRQSQRQYSACDPSK